MLLGNLQGPVLLLGLILSFSALLIQDDSPALPTPSEDRCSEAEPVTCRNYLGASLDLPASAFKPLCVIPAQIAGDTSSGRLPCHTQKCLT